MTQLADKDMTETFWDRLEDCRTGMLVIEGRAVPMSHYVDENKRELWFITAKGTYMAENAKGGQAHYVLCNDKEGLYASLSGRLTPEINKEKLDEYWDNVDYQIVYIFFLTSFV